MQAAFSPNFSDDDTDVCDDETEPAWLPRQDEEPRWMTVIQGSVSSRHVCIVADRDLWRPDAHVTFFHAAATHALADGNLGHLSSRPQQPQQTFMRPGQYATLYASVDAALHRLEEAERLQAEISEHHEQLAQRLQFLERVAGFDKNSKKAPKDERMLWCETHLDEIAKYPGEFLAIDATDGIVAHANDGRMLMEQLAPGMAKRVLVVHASQFA